MVFWAGILLGGAFVFYAVKMGFYETWALLFNIVISVYLAVFLAPAIADIFPMVENKAYNNALCMMVTAGASFVILHGVTYVFFTGQFEVSFPKIFDFIGSGFLGFLAGFLVWGFVCLLVLITPISQNDFAKKFGFGNQLEQTNISYLSWWCDRINNFVTLDNKAFSTEQVIRELLKSDEKKTPCETEESEPNQTGENTADS